MIIGYNQSFKFRNVLVMYVLCWALMTHASPTDANLLIKAQPQQLAPIASPQQCGNGVVEGDEECDYGAPQSEGCCTDKCKNLPDFTTQCPNAGICQNGKCISRQSQCSNFNNRYFIIGNQSYTGPFTPCDPVGNKTVQNIENTCNLACLGQAQSNLCIDFTQYLSPNNNFDNTVGDGVICGPSQSGNELGVCYKGKCDLRICSASLCNNRGRCYRTRGNQFECRCDSGFNGPTCNIGRDCGGELDYCGVCNGDNSTCSFDFYNLKYTLPPDDRVGSGSGIQNNQLFQTWGIPIISAASAAVILLSVFFGHRYVRNRRKHKRAQKNNYKRNMKRANSTSSSISNSSVNSFVAGGNKRKNLGRRPSQTSANRMGISVKFDEYRVTLPYTASMPDELDLKEGDIVFKLFEYDDGWAKGYNTSTQKEGVYPVSFTERVDYSRSSGSTQQLNSQTKMQSV
ncbi:hypothetical protein MP228_004790 [Amoeboaphelidium protococcarum]|nr:hypothetical protein MP228_004790 [Amoeboaphelidium protococcarum]